MVTHQKKTPRFSLSDWANISSCLLALLAIIVTLYQFSSSISRENKISRPVLAVSSTDFTYGGIMSAPQFHIKNYGVRPAANIEFTSLTFTDNGRESIKLIESYEGTSANSLANGIEINFNLKPMIPEITIYLYKLKFKYLDAVTNEEYSDSMYYEWAGMVLDSTMNHSQIHSLDIKKVKNIIHQ